MSPTRNQLLAAAKGLCNDFASQKDLDTLLSHFTQTHQPTAIEYGEPYLAPFLGRPFVGLPKIRGYFELLAKHLTYENMRFSEYVVDAEASKVSVKGKARFTWTATKQSWDETFAYVLDFDQDAKVTEYQVWADSGAAYLARKGKLDEARKVRTQ